MPPPSLSMTTRVGARSAPSKPLTSCKKHRSPHSPTVGVVARLRRPPPSTRSRRCRWRRDSRGRGGPSRGAMHHSSARTGRLDATTSVAPFGKASRDVARDHTFDRRVGRVEHAVDGRTRKLLGAQPTIEPRPRRGARRGSAGSRFERIRQGRKQRFGRHAYPLVRSMHRIEPRIGRDRRRLSAPAPSSHAFAILLVSGAPMRTTRSGRCGAGERRRAEQRLVGRDRVWPAAHLRHRDRRAAANLRRRRTASPSRASHPRPSPRPRRRSGARAPSPRAPRRGPRRAATGARRVCVHGAPSGRPGASTKGAPVGTSGSRNGRLRCTGPGRRSDRMRPRTARERTPRRARTFDRLGRTRIVEPAHRVAVQLRSGRSSARRPHRAARADGRRCTRAAVPARGKPRSPRDGSSRPRFPRCSTRSRAGRRRARCRAPRNAAERSSSTTWTRIRSSRASARASGVEREPGAIDGVGASRPRPLVDECSARTPSSRPASGVTALAGCRASRRSSVQNGPVTIVFVHGFTQTASAWSSVVRGTTGLEDTIMFGDLPIAATFEETAHAIGDLGGARHVRRLLDGRPALPATGARPSRPRARARARERVARVCARPPNAPARVAADEALAAGHRTRRCRRVPHPLARATDVRVGPARRAPASPNGADSAPEYLTACLRVLGTGSDGTDVGPTGGAGDAGARSSRARDDAKFDRHRPAMIERRDRRERRQPYNSKADTRCRSNGRDVLRRSAWSRSHAEHG